MTAAIPEPKAEARRAVLQVRQDRLQRLARRVRPARIAEARIVVDPLPDEGRAGVDRRDDRAGLRVGLLIGVDQERVEPPLSPAPLLISPFFLGVIVLPFRYLPLIARDRRCARGGSA